MDDSIIADILNTTRHIALVGASNNESRPSFTVMAYLLGQGYKVTPVNPKLVGQTILGQKVYAQLRDIPEPIDMVDVFRNADAACEVAQEAIAVGAKSLWLQLGVVNHQAAERATKGGLKVVMDRCPKLDIPRIGLQKKG